MDQASINWRQQRDLEIQQDIADFKKLLHDNGYTVIEYIPKEGERPVTWFHFFKDGRMGYVQKGYYSGYDYSISYIPTKDWGSGHGVMENVMELSLENAERCMKFWPGRCPAKRYESVEQFIGRETVLRYRIYQP